MFSAAEGALKSNSAGPARLLAGSRAAIEAACLAAATASAAVTAATPALAANSAEPAPATLSSALNGAFRNSSASSAMMHRSAEAALMALVPAQVPVTTAICGTTPETRAISAVRRAVAFNRSRPPSSLAPVES